MAAASSSSAASSCDVALPEFKYGEELVKTARAIAAPGKGILAADESTGTIGKRLANINVENNRENRKAYRHLLLTTKKLGDSISGIILFEETLNEEGFVELAKKAGIIPGIKTDKGTRPIPGTNGDTFTQGIDGLLERSQAYYAAGARFAKYRNVLRCNNGQMSELSIKENAWTLARYAAISQAAGLVPIIEPEFLCLDGAHNIATSRYWTEKILAAVYKACSDQGVLLEGTLLKPNMVMPGRDCKSGPASPAEVARHTLAALQRTVPAAVPGIVFLSGGQSEEEATLNLNALNQLAKSGQPGTAAPWSLTFSFGRALQKSCLAAWQGKKANIAAGQAALLERANANGQAQLGKYKGGAGGKAAKETLYVKGYTY